MTGDELLFIGETTNYELRRLSHAATGQPVMGADVSLTLRDARTGEAVQGADWPRKFVQMQPGHFLCALPGTLRLTHGQRLAGVVMVNPTKAEATAWQVSFMAVQRRA